MTEISKMFENTGASKIIPKICSNNELDCIGCIAYTKNTTPYCKSAEYPDFTAEKQLRLIEWFISNSWWLNLKSLDKKNDFSLSFDEKLAKLVNRLWESFDDQEKVEIRNILNA